jgi:glycosyltransferase involved in cell wall biosynthesis
MKVAVDLQCCQGGARFRGIGRYVLALTKAMIQVSPHDEFWIVINDNFPESDEYLRSSFRDLLPPHRVVAFSAPSPSTPAAADRTRLRSAEFIREHFISSLEPDIIYVGSLCEGISESVVSSVGLSIENRPTVATLFDLIPFMKPHEYAASPVAQEWYEEKLRHVKRADLLLAISESSRAEAITHLDFDPSCVINILGGCGAEFYPESAGSLECSDTLKEFGVHKKFFLSVATFEPRKNIAGFMRAASLLPIELFNDYQFVLISDPASRDLAHLEETAFELGMAPGQFIVTGRLSDAQLRCFYSSCYVFVFPSFHEGFGLPVLEAMQCGAATIGSNATSIPEIIGLSEAVFNPARPDEIAQLMTRLARDGAFHSKLRDHALSRAMEFSWSKSAEKALLSMHRLAATMRPKKQVAVSSWFGPTRYERLINGCAGTLIGASVEDKVAAADAISKNASTLQLLAANGHLSPQKDKQALPPLLDERNVRPLTSSICRESDFRRADYHRWMGLLKETPRYHRKQWEFYFVSQALEEQGLLSEGRSGVGFGVGTEPLPAAFAARRVKILASDQGIEDAKRIGWVDSDQHSTTVDMLNDRYICDPELFAASVRFREIDMNDIPSDLYRQFDFAWSACCLEHLGSINNGLDFIVNSTRLLRPGGVCVHTTELNMSSNDDTFESQDLVLFRRRDIERVVRRLEVSGFCVLPIDWSTGDGWLDDYVDLPPYIQAPHLRLRLSKFASTSIGLIIKRLDE